MANTDGELLLKIRFCIPQITKNGILKGRLLSTRHLGLIFVGRTAQKYKKALENVNNSTKSRVSDN